MNGATLARHLLAARLRSPVAWGVATGFALAHAGLAWRLAALDEALHAAAAVGSVREAPALLGAHAANVGLLLVLLGPVVAGPSLARGPVDDLLRGAPIGASTVVLGTFGAAATETLAVALSCLAAAALGLPSAGPAALGAVGAVGLMALLTAAVGVLASALVERAAGAVALGWAAVSVAWIAGRDGWGAGARFENLAGGVLRAADVGVFAALVAASLILAAGVWERRRWR